MFLDLWRRRNSEIAFRWGVDGVEDKELMRIAALKVRGEAKGQEAFQWTAANSRAYRLVDQMVEAHHVRDKGVYLYDTLVDWV